MNPLPLPLPSPGTRLSRRDWLATGGAFALLATAGCATRRSPLAADVAAALAPTGTLRASINVGNPILARRDPAAGAAGVAGAVGAPAGSGGAVGVSVDLARELARQLGVGLELLVFDAAARSVDAVRAEQADIGFFAIDPLRSQGIRFTAPYVLIEGSYLVRQDSPLTGNEQVDRAGTRIVVGRGSAYDLFLSREIKAAQLERAPTSPAVVDDFLARHADVAAGVTQQLQADAARLDGLRLLPGRFMVIEQAMGLPASRGDGAAQALASFVERMKASGFVAAALQRHAIQGAIVAPAA